MSDEQTIAAPTIDGHCWHEKINLAKKEDDFYYCRFPMHDVCCYCDAKYDKEDKVQDLTHGEFAPANVTPVRPAGPCPERIIRQRCAQGWIRYEAAKPEPTETVALWKTGWPEGETVTSQGNRIPKEWRTVGLLWRPVKVVA